MGERNKMKSIRSNKFTALASLIAILVVSNWVSGCAGFAEPLPTLSATPNNVSVTAATGATASQVITLANTGTTNVILTQATITGAGFTTSGLTLPMAVASGATQNFMVKFSSTGVTTVNGTIVLVTDAAHRPVTVQLKGQSTSSSAPVSSMSIAPAATSVATSGKFQFTASVQGTTANTNVNWSASAGTITPYGLFTAPTASGVATVTATSVADPTKSAVATVTITSTSSPSSGAAVSSVTITPSTANSTTGGTLPFSATVAGSTTNKTVTWSAVRGKITAAGIYTAPTTAVVDTITATSNADATKSGTAKVIVTTASTSNPGSPASTVTAVAITPSSASSTTGGTLQFTASVTGTATDKSVAWKAMLGQITTTGQYTAPPQPGTDTVTATSNADSAETTSASVSVSARVSSGVLPAFLGAEGGGALTIGGRGGQVIEITNLNDSGAGSYRNCVQASGPRTCVFRVAGLITPQSDVIVTSPYLTIAGQTAPGEVIIGGPGNQGFMLRISTHDVIVRYITISPDDWNQISGPDTGTVGTGAVNCAGDGTPSGGGCYNIIWDHITSRWAGNKTWLLESNFTPGQNGNGNGTGPSHDITLQWFLNYEPHAGHPVGVGTESDESCNGSLDNQTGASSGSCVSPFENNIDFHHGLIANVSHRIPENSSNQQRWTNMITYNWYFYANEWLGAGNIDVRNNKWVCGNLNAAGPAQTYPIHFTTNSPEMSGAPGAYVNGNIGCGQTAPNSDQYGSLVNQIAGENGDEQGPIPANWQRSSPLPDTAVPITVDPATNLDALILPTVGNSQHLNCSGNWVSHRDAADQRIVAQYQNKSAGGFWPNGLTYTITNQTSPGQIPQPSAGWQDNPVINGTACTESLHDGIPDQWKSAKALSTTDSSVANTKAPNGYTWLENYLNGQ
jgi:hypothetical protein